MNEKIVITQMSRCVRLEWESIPVIRKFDEFTKAIPANWNDQNIGLYAFEGKHHAHTTGTVLYIGMTMAAGGHRTLQSAESRFFREEEPRTMYGSYWDLILRWAPLAPKELFPDDPNRVETTKELTRALENLLIMSMKPPLNAQGVDGWLNKTAWDLVVGNCGDKGLLLPMLHGHDCFFSHKEWTACPAGDFGE